MAIPKRIICTGHSAYLRSPLHLKCLHRLREVHGDWEIQFFDAVRAEEMLKTEWPTMLPFWRDLETVQSRNLLISLVCALKMGGFFLPASSWLETPLHELCDQRLVLASSGDYTAEEFEECYGHAAESAAHRAQITHDSFACEAGHWFGWELLRTFMDVAQEKQAMRMPPEFDHEPSFATLCHVMNCDQFGAGETVLASPAGSIFSTFGSYATRIG